VDIETGASTPLPESIVGTEDVTGAYAVSPDGSRLAYVGRGDNDGVGIFVANLDGTGIEQVTVELRGEARPSGGGAGPAFEVQPAWSPDGSKIAYIGRRANGAHGNVYLLDLATGVSTQVTDDPRDGAMSPTFSPDGSTIIYQGGDQILAVPVAGGASVPMVGGDGAYAQHPALSPDGSLLSYVCGKGSEGSTGICLANADGSGARVFVPVAFAEYPGWSPDGTRIVYWSWQSADVYVVDVATGEETPVPTKGGLGAFPVWLDNHTLIVEADSCSLPPHQRCPF
jgi:Tol biopolymer transport system component